MLRDVNYTCVLITIVLPICSLPITRNRVCSRFQTLPRPAYQIESTRHNPPSLQLLLPNLIQIP
jgi:hypothetical protein